MIVKYPCHYASTCSLLKGIFLCTISPDTCIKYKAKMRELIGQRSP